MREFKFRKLIKAELESGLLCQYLLPSRVACNRVAKRMVWEPIAPEVEQPFCEAHTQVAIALLQAVASNQAEGENVDSVSILDLDAAGDSNDETALTPTENTEKTTDGATEVVEPHEPGLEHVETGTTDEPADEPEKPTFKPFVGTKLDTL